MITLSGLKIILLKVLVQGDIMSINRLMIEEKVNNAKKYLNSLRKLLDDPNELFLSDLDMQLRGERLFEVLAQIMLDICTHIVAHSDIETPASYSECMNALEKMGIFSEEESTTFISIIKMRNLIVHQYGVIDYQMLFNSLKVLENDFLRFRDGILGWLETLNKDLSEK